MPRKLRIQYPGAMYHVMNRGDQREAIFRDDEDRQRFLVTLGEACQKTEWQVHAYCLMSNHFHLVVETPQPNLVVGMKWLLGGYTKRYNIRHKLCGHVFAGRYKALVVEGSGNGYLRTACDYVHLNPVRAGLVKPGVPLESFRWTLRNRPAGDGGAESGKDRARRTRAVELVGAGAARPAQGAPGQSSDRAPAAPGDDHELEMDRPAAGDGDLDLCLEPAQRESSRFTRSGGAAVVSIVRNDTCSITVNTTSEY